MIWRKKELRVESREEGLPIEEIEVPQVIITKQD